MGDNAAMRYNVEKSEEISRLKQQIAAERVRTEKLESKHEIKLIHLSRELRQVRSDISTVLEEIKSKLQAHPDLGEENDADFLASAERGVVEDASKLNESTEIVEIKPNDESPYAKPAVQSTQEEKSGVLLDFPQYTCTTTVRSVTPPYLDSHTLPMHTMISAPPVVEVERYVTRLPEYHIPASSNLSSMPAVPFVASMSPSRVQYWKHHDEGETYEVRSAYDAISYDYPMNTERLVGTIHPSANGSSNVTESSYDMGSIHYNVNSDQGLDANNSSNAWSYAASQEF